MGNLCCCFKGNNDYYDDDEYGETRRILDNPVGINDSTGEPNDIHSIRVEHTHPPYYGSTGVNGIQSNKQEQNDFYQCVLDRLSSRVIDISLFEKSCEQADLTDREQNLNNKLSRIYKPIRINSNQPFMQNSNSSCYDYVAKSKDPINLDEYKLITSLASKSAAAVNYGFVIHSNESFVVNFDS